MDPLNTVKVNDSAIMEKVLEISAKTLLKTRKEFAKYISFQCFAKLGINFTSKPHLILGKIKSFSE